MTSKTNFTAEQSPEAMASMADIGRGIDQAIGRLSPPALGLPTIQLVSRNDDAERDRGSWSPAPQIDERFLGKVGAKRANRAAIAVASSDFCFAHGALRARTHHSSTG